MFLLCLIAALSGTPLRQGEAASDFARSLAESEGGQIVEMIDGGVGDDSGATILNASGDTHSAPATIPASADGMVPPLVSGLSPSVTDDRRRANRTAWLTAGPVPRQAWLQCFLF